MQKIVPCLWFDNQAEEAVKFYTSIFPNSKITSTARYGEAAAAASGRPKGTVMTITFQLDGQEFMALNGGPVFTFSPAISLMVYCKTQAELDEFWERLAEGGEEQQCGWLIDKFGVSWQIIPTALEEIMAGQDTEKSERTMAALLQMRKLDIATLMRASEQ